AGRLRHAARPELVERRLLEFFEGLFLCAIGTEIRHNRAHVGHADLWRGRVQRERLTGPRDTRQLEQQPDLALARAGEYRRLGVEAENARRPAEMRLENLADVHSGGHAERIEYDVDRPAIGQERHVFFGHDAGNDALV